MILCPNCMHKEMVGAIFCSECGAQLVYADGVPTSVIPPSHSNPLPHQDLHQEVSDSHVSPSNIRITLNIVNSGEVLNLGQRSEFTLGRVSEGQPIIPDIDLTPYNAYDSGVSRMHLSIKIKDQVYVTDLGSANGTRINGRRVGANMPYVIKHGDILTLGKFNIQILFHTNQ